MWRHVHCLDAYMYEHVHVQIYVVCTCGYTHVFQCTKKRSYADIQMIQKTDLANITDSKYRWCYIYINTCLLFDVTLIVGCLNRRVFSVILFAMVGIVCMLWLISYCVSDKFSTCRAAI